MEKKRLSLPYSMSFSGGVYWANITVGNKSILCDGLSEAELKREVTRKLLEEGIPRGTFRLVIKQAIKI